MGHGYPKNLGRVFYRRLYAKGKLSISEAVAAAIAQKEYAQAAEGDYQEPEMIAHFLELIVGFLRCHHGPRTQSHPQGKADPIIVPVEPLTDAQRAILKTVDTDDDHWFEGHEDPETTFNSIHWKFAPGWRAAYPGDLPLLDYVCN